MNDVQKNWKKAWKDYEPTENDLIYHAPRKRDWRDSFKPPVWVIVAAVIVLGLGGSYFWPQISTKLYGSASAEHADMVTGSVVQPNKNGTVMKTSVSKIEDIFKKLQADVKDISKEDINTYIEEVNSLDLSEEYNDVKGQCVSKLKKAEECSDAYQKCLKAKSADEQKKLKKELDAKLSEYNTMDIYESISKAFDEVGVKYSDNDAGGINFEYYE